MKNNDKKNQSKIKSIHVRVTEEEYNRLLEDSKNHCLSLPSLLRKKYFSKLPTKILMSQENFNSFHKTYSGYANNCNQLAKKAHLGFEVPLKAIIDLIRGNEKLFNFVGGLNGHR